MEGQFIERVSSDSKVPFEELRAKFQGRLEEDRKALADMKRSYPSSSDSKILLSIYEDYINKQESVLKSYSGGDTFSAAFDLNITEDRKEIVKERLAGLTLDPSTKPLREPEETPRARSPYPRLSAGPLPADTVSEDTVKGSDGALKERRGSGLIIGKAESGEVGAYVALPVNKEGDQIKVGRTTLSGDESSVNYVGLRVGRGDLDRGKSANIGAYVDDRGGIRPSVDYTVADFKNDKKGLPTNVRVTAGFSPTEINGDGALSPSVPNVRVNVSKQLSTRSSSKVTESTDASFSGFLSTEKIGVQKAMIQWERSSALRGIPKNNEDIFARGVIGAGYNKMHSEFPGVYGGFGVHGFFGRDTSWRWSGQVGGFADIRGGLKGGVRVGVSKNITNNVEVGLGWAWGSSGITENLEIPIPLPGIFGKLGLSGFLRLRF